MINRLLNILILFVVLIGCSNQGDNKSVEISLKTLQCGMCTIVYNASMIDLNAIENTIASIGYDANDTPADPKVYETLELCCKVPGK